MPTPTTTESAKDNVVPIRAKGKSSRARSFEEKWGVTAGKVGFTMIPTSLLRGAGRLQLDPPKFAIILQLLEHWWERDRDPYPSKETIARRVKLSPRQVQRHIAALEAEGLVQRNERRAPGRGKTSNGYDLSGLVARVAKLSEEILEENEEARKRRTALEKPGLRKRAKPSS